MPPAEADLGAARQRRACSAAEPAGSGAVGGLPLRGRRAAPSWPRELSPPSAFPGLSQSCGLSAQTACVTRVKLPRDGKRRRLGQRFCRILMISPRCIYRISPGSGLVSDSGGLALAGTPSLHAAQGALCQPSSSGFAFRAPVLASRDHPRQGDPSRLQSVPADHGAHSTFTTSSAPSHPPPALSAAGSSPPLVSATGVQAALSYCSLLRLSLLSGT